MIVRISGTGQFELDETGIRRLDELDTALTDAYQRGDEHAFKHALADTIRFVQETGTPVPDERVVASEVIIPPEEISLDDAHAYMTDEGLMQPLEV